MAREEENLGEIEPDKTMHVKQAGVEPEKGRLQKQNKVSPHFEGQKWGEGVTGWDQKIGG